MSDGQLALNTNLVSPGLFLKDSNGDAIKVGPVHIGTTAPNAAPASGGTSGNSAGESWLDTSGTNPVLKVWSGSAWVSINSAGGTGVTTADVGTVTSTMIADNTLLNIDINDSAAIAHSKLANITAGSVLLGNASSVPTATALSGDVTVSNTGVTAIGTGVIVNADVNASAAIAHSKLATLTAGQVLLGNASNVPTATAVTGDVTISSGGVTAIGAGVIVNADINASAAIADTKLATIATAGKVSNSATTATSANTVSAIVARDGSGNFSAGTITASLAGNAATVTTNANLTGDITSVGNATSIASGVIVNADVNVSAGIAGTKISPNFGGQNALTTGTVGCSSILFNGDTAAANALDDYEEGTFTPTIVGATTPGTGTYSTQSGEYTKIGNAVYFIVRIAWSAHTGAGSMRVSGLPFANSTLLMPVALRQVNLTAPANQLVQPYVGSSSSQVIFESVPVAGGATSGLVLDTAAEVAVAGHYFI
jgi:hypothetical protein